jgi:flagellar FliL protein
MAKSEEPAAEVEAPKKGKGKLLIIIAVAAVLVIGGGVAAFLMLSKPAAEEGEHAEEEAHAEDEHPPIYEKLETFTVNLADQESFLQTDVQLMLDDPAIQEKIKTRMPEVRDALLRLLSSKTAEELSQQEGKDKLAEEIQKQVNELLELKEKEKGVKKVLFAAFIIQ